MAGLIGFTLMMTVPFLVPFHYFPMNMFYAEWTAFALGLVAMALIFAGSSDTPIKIPPVAVGLLALVLVIALQVAFSYVAYVETALLAAYYAIWASLLMIASANLREMIGQERVVSFLQGALIFGGTVSAAIGFIQYYQIETPWGHFIDVQRQMIGYMFGLVGQRNNFSNYLSCALISVFFMHARGKLGAPIALFAVGIMVSALVLAASRSTFVYLGIAAVAILSIRRVEPSMFRPMLRLGLFVLLVFVLVHILTFNTDWLSRPGIPTNTAYGRMAEEKGGLEGVQYRIPLLLKAWAAFKSSPLLGVGVGELPLSMFWYTADMLPPVTPKLIDRHAHNLFAQLLAEFGLAGFFVVSGGLLLWALNQFKQKMSASHVWALSLIAILGAHSMVEFPLWIAHFLGIFAVLLGITSRQTEAVTYSRSMRWSLFAVCFTGVAMAGIYFVDYRNIERWYLQVEARQNAGTLPGAKDLQELMRYHERSIFVPWIESVATSAIVLNKEGIEEKLALNSQVMHPFPTPVVVERQIALLELAGKDGEARRAMLAWERLWPLEAQARLRNFEALAKENPARFAELARYLRELISARVAQSEAAQK
jgi:O-antigen ligase